MFTGGEGADLSESFTRFVARAMQVDGIVFLQSGPGDKLSMLQDWSAKRVGGKAHASRLAMSMHADEIAPLVLLAGGVQRYANHKAQFALHGADGAELPYFVDLDHDAGHGVRPSKNYPTALRHGKPFEFRSGTFCTPDEAFVAMGFDVFPALSEDRPISATYLAAKKYGESSMRSLVGNAMHSPLYALWMHFILGQCHRVAEFYDPLRYRQIFTDSVEGSSSASSHRQAPDAD